MSSKTLFFIITPDCLAGHYKQNSDTRIVKSCKKIFFQSPKQTLRNKTTILVLKFLNDNFHLKHDLCNAMAASMTDFCQNNFIQSNKMGSSREMTRQMSRCHAMAASMKDFCKNNFIQSNKTGSSREMTRQMSRCHAMAASMKDFCKNNFIQSNKTGSSREMTGQMSRWLRHKMR